MILTIITIVITIVVMWKSNKNANDIAEMQMNFEAKTLLRQEEIQKRQIKVATYTYKLDYIKSFYKLEYSMKGLYGILKLIDLDKESFSKLYDKYNRLNLEYTDIISSLELSKNVFSTETFDFIDDIKMYFTIIHENFFKFQMYSKGLTIDEQNNLKKEKEDGIKKINDAIQCILYDLRTVLPKLNKDICISDIHL